MSCIDCLLIYLAFEESVHFFSVPYDINRAAKPLFELLFDANKVEKVHAELYKKYLDNIGNNPDTAIFVCQVCGNTVEGAAPDKCPICGNPKEMFKEIK